MTKFSSISDAITAIANGQMVIIVDDEDRENEGDLAMAARFVTPDAINFMITHGRGLVCVPMADEYIQRLELPDMTPSNTDNFGTAFTLSIDASPKHGVTTGISASDRAKTIQMCVNPNATKSDFVFPGHIFPLRARNMGVMRRAGHTEAIVDLSRLAGLEPAGVICEILKPDGQMARVPDLFEMADQFKMPMITIQDLIAYRRKHEQFIQKIETITMPTSYGDFQLHAYEDTLNHKEHLALTMGDIDSDSPTLVRVHSECLTGDVFQSKRCDCGQQLNAALRLIAEKKSGVLLYMRHEGRGIGLMNKLKAYKLQEEGKDTVEANEALGFDADLREYGIGAQILLNLGVRQFDLITNNPKKIIGLDGHGLTLNQRVPIVVQDNDHNRSYLDTKMKRMGHWL